ncbi:hypothetical protein BDV27DRAFT_148049 [Aspergillus caelatus]|uniref:GST C-terminal domain-containing protein n=1 Tax=Aspergillus caelatus TaxID=61420 RepID=A0A5N6ZUA1_9EURO|nr:uncharacterized protein BDV27DRAFT_148049 [Aspergillus caelatus]KAE8361191.1 hypothetical protein BDV27DRAFT_148049 [Aspergillus caelatus]
MENPGIQSSDLPHSLQLDSLSGVAEDASTLAAAQAQAQQHQHEIQEHVPSAESTDAQSLHPLQTAIETLDPYSIQQHEGPNEARSFREPYNNNNNNNLLPRDDSHSLHMQPQCNTFSEASIFSPKQGGYLRDMPSVLDPPDLDLWRERLFNVDETIVLSEEQFLAYFPHVDNIYSHRSTQHYKRKPLISHYWDCRLKGRPPGTPKSDDPNKKKRKRTARQRDLCDVKIKITEYFPGYSPMMIAEGAANDAAAALGAESLSSGDVVFPPPEDPEPRDRQPFGVLTPNPPLPEGHPGANGQRFFTIQRVNGNGANGKNDGVSGGHRHTLEESDRVKKNSVQRYLLKEAREKKKASSSRTMSTQNQPPQKTYHTKATGLAAVTVSNHSSENELKLYGSCFCPFVQRVWIALEAKGIPYQYIEVDPYKKPQSLLELEDLNTGPPLLPPGDAKLRAHCRLWADFINRNIVPNFYRVLQEQAEQKQISNAQELKDAFATLVNAADTQGPFFLGPNMSFVDIQVAPWIIRLNRVLKPYRGWPDADAGSRWGAWVNAIEANEHVKATTSDDELYFDSYERYAQNRPNTSLLANAINSGRALP